MFKTGDRIGSYVLKEQIGKGAFGVVWLAEETTVLTAHKVALKLPNEEIVNIEAIRQEASLWEQVKGHPNVLPIIKADIVDNQIYIASEYAPDGSLADWLKRNGGKAPSITSAVEITKGILAGLGHLHTKQVIHRDLKPDNILLQDETPRIADFGIARALKESHSSQIAGTPNYMAPEGFKGVRSEQTDVWAAGVIFYQLLTGLLPFPQTDLMSLMNAIVCDEPQIDAQRVPEQLLPIINKALKRDLSKRYQIVTAMRDDLRKIQLDDLEAEAIAVTTTDTQPATDRFELQSVTNPQDIPDTLPSKPSAATPLFINKTKMFKWSGGVLAVAIIIAGIVYAGINFSKNSVRGQDTSITDEIINVNTALKTELSKDSVENRLKWAEWAQMLEDDEYEKIVRETTEEIERNPQNAIAYRMRATAYDNQNKIDSVRMDIREVLRLTDNPLTAEEYEAKCYALKMLNKSDEALKNCTKALELDSDLALAYNVLGTIHYQKGRYELAIAEYSKAIERISRASFFENRAISYEEMGKKKLAAADYEMANILRNSKLPVPLPTAEAEPLTRKPEVHSAAKPKAQAMAEKPKPQPKPKPKPKPKAKVTMDDILKP